jgi:DNA-binding NarL/FixJ family response regulator
MRRTNFLFAFGHQHQIDRHLSTGPSNGMEGRKNRRLRFFLIHRAATHEHFAQRRFVHDSRFGRRRRPFRRVELLHVVHEMKTDRLRSAARVCKRNISLLTESTHPKRRSRPPRDVGDSLRAGPRLPCRGMDGSQQPPAKQKDGAARVLIVDAWPAARDGLALRLAAEPDLEVCGEADSVAEAFNAVAAGAPDVAVVGIALKVGDGIDLIKRLSARHKRVRAVVWSMYSEDLYAERAFRAGALAYVNKQEPTAAVIAAIRAVLAGHVFCANVVRGGTGDVRCFERAIHALSDRELQVFRLIGAGLGTRDIGAHMQVGTKTVETYRDRLRRKLGLTTGTDLLRVALVWTLALGRKAE